MPQERIVLGIDPGLATIGYAFLRLNGDTPKIIDFGVIETSPEHSFSDRLLNINRDLIELLKQYQPDDVYVEELFFSTNSKTALSVAHARGVILSTLASYGLDPQILTPNQVKSGLTGDGRADKKQIQDMLVLQFALDTPPQPDDAADALAIAYCGGLVDGEWGMENE